MDCGKKTSKPITVPRPQYRKQAWGSQKECVAMPSDAYCSAIPFSNSSCRPKQCFIYTCWRVLMFPLGLTELESPWFLPTLFWETVVWGLIPIILPLQISNSFHTLPPNYLAFVIGMLSGDHGRDGTTFKHSDTLWRIITISAHIAHGSLSLDIATYIATMAWHDARPHVSWDFAEDGAGALFRWPTGAFKLVLLRQRCARQRRVYILHVIVKVMTAERAFCLTWHAIGWGPAISVFTGGTSSCLAAAQLFSPNVVDHARLKKICGRTGIGAHTSANCFWQLAPGSGWRFATAAVPRRQKDAKGFLKCDATLSVGKSWASSPLIAIAFGGMGELCIPGGPTPVSPSWCFKMLLRSTMLSPVHPHWTC